MKKATVSLVLTSLCLSLVVPSVLAQTPAAPPAPAKDKDAATKEAAAKAATAAPKLLKPQDLKWNESLQWVSVVIDEGGVQPVRDYFGALAKPDMDALVAGTSKGMVRLQQAFYFNEATRSFTRFNTTLPGATVSLYQNNAYFRHDTFMRILPLSRQFVENLAVSGFLKVEGE